VNLIVRKFRTLIFLVLVIGLAGGAIMSRSGMQVTLGPVLGVTATLGQPTTKPAAVAASAAATGAASRSGVGTTAQTGQPAAANRPITGTVQQVDSTTITLTVQSGALTRATVSSSTTLIKNTTITAADIKVGDTVTVIGQAAPDGSVTAQQVTDGAAAQAGGAGSFTRQGTGGSGQSGTGFTAGAGITRTTGITGAASGQAVTSAIAGTVQAIDSSTMTVTEQSGQMIKVALDASTRLRKTTAVAMTDITAGAQVTITGQAAADGSITATMVQISSPS
jgi:hypothetical protein